VYKVYIKIERKEKLLIPKWDLLEKHVKKKNNEEGVKVVNVKCTHARNEIKFVSMNCLSILEQTHGGFKGKKHKEGDLICFYIHVSCVRKTHD
jgi:hypothetical protein